MPILGLQSSSRNIPSYGTVGTVEYPEHQLGIFHVKSGTIIPEEAKWIVARSSDYGRPNLLENPSFELGFLGWRLYTPSGNTPLTVDILSGYLGNSAVMISDELGYRGGATQSFRDVPPNTTFHFKAMIKSVDVESLEATIFYRDVYDAEENWYGGDAGKIVGSNDWTLYETVFITPNAVTNVYVYPISVRNRGQVWMDEVFLTIESLHPPTVPVILNWYSFRPSLPIRTQEALMNLEEGLKTITTEKFWGILGPTGAEEVYRTHIDFHDEVNTTWFSERLLGYPLYLMENTGASVDEWKDEMYLRMIRGFYNYFHPLMKIGIVWGWPNPEYWNTIYGEPATAFIRQYYDFLFLYPYTENLDYWLQHSKPYLSAVEELFPNQKKFWLLTRIWDDNRPRWQLEAMALELKNCFDRNIPVLSYRVTEPAFEEVWYLILKAIELYDINASYYENLVYGRNLLTGYVGDTYGWVEVLG
jgi:hypothetical protein